MVDKTLSGTYESAYDLADIDVGTSLVIQNKSSSYLLIELAKDKPDDKMSSGFTIAPNETRYLSGITSNCWLKGVGPVAIMEYS